MTPAPIQNKVKAEEELTETLVFDFLSSTVPLDRITRHRCFETGLVKMVWLLQLLRQQVNSTLPQTRPHRPRSEPSAGSPGPADCSYMAPGSPSETEGLGLTSSSPLMNDRIGARHRSLNSGQSRYSDLMPSSMQPFRSRHVRQCFCKFGHAGRVDHALAVAVLAMCARREALEELSTLRVKFADAMGNHSKVSG